MGLLNTTSLAPIISNLLVPSPPPSSYPQEASNSSGTQAGVIAGIIISVVFAVAIAMGSIYYFYYLKDSRAIFAWLGLGSMKDTSRESTTNGQELVTIKKDRRKSNWISQENPISHQNERYVHIIIAVELTYRHNCLHSTTK